ncbi:hypothetical protein WME73_08540 [Sorangium sp. So ce302]|uniref:hypothetical protein n=1 Tax=Sorangium sp. So ce302 TaxID=3133297 RepID=UPI003F600009
MMPSQIGLASAFFGVRSTSGVSLHPRPAGCGWALRCGGRSDADLAGAIAIYEDAAALLEQVDALLAGLGAVEKTSRPPNSFGLGGSLGWERPRLP